MSVSLLAVECPAVLAPSSFISISAAGSLSTGNAPVSESIVSGQSPTTPWTPMQRRNATRADNLSRFGAGGYAIANGLILSAPTSGLQLSIATGLAIIDGPVAVESAALLAIPDSTTRAWIWLLQAGTLTYALTTTPPAAACCLLGNVTTIGGNIVRVDTSGVLYMKGGTLWRQTAEEGPPEDTPPATLQFFARTQGGLYFWDGSEYTVVGDAAALLALSAYALVDDLDNLSRKFRALLLSLTHTVGDEVITTEELAEDLELASEEA